jgi:hypothetical protein
MLKLEHNQGRLIEVRARGLVTLPEFTAMRSDYTASMLRIGRRLVLAVDVRELGILTEEVAERLLQLMRMDNPLVERGGYIVTPGTAAGARIATVINAGGNPDRRCFSGVQEMFDFLSPSLDPAEQARLSAFLG